MALDLINGCQSSTRHGRRWCGSGTNGERTNGGVIRGHILTVSAGEVPYKCFCVYRGKYTLFMPLYRISYCACKVFIEQRNSFLINGPRKLECGPPPHSAPFSCYLSTYSCTNPHPADINHNKSRTVQRWPLLDWTWKLSKYVSECGASSVGGGSLTISKVRDIINSAAIRSSHSVYVVVETLNEQ